MKGRESIDNTNNNGLVVKKLSSLRSSAVTRKNQGKRKGKEGSDRGEPRKREVRNGEIQISSP